ncbi:MAG: hypothetical protein JWP87_3542 [Labilithrix sp.]|nr:hypothetical protein [Labilithrix sp.]
MIEGTASTASGPPGRILVVDDERDNRELMEIVLRWEGFVVVTATSGGQALAMIAQERPDLVLLDVMMPGMTGYEVAAKIKANATTKDIPVIMVTALEDSSAKALARRAGADDFLTKPISRGELLACVRAVLSKGQEADDRASSLQ